MKVSLLPRSSKLNYGDFAVTGLQDCQNGFEAEMFDFDAGDTAEQVFDAAFDDSVKEAWLAGSDVDEIVEDGLDPVKCYEEWRKAYRRCALPLVREAMEWAKRRRMEGTVQFYLETFDGDEDHGEIVEAYSSAEEALIALAAVPAGKIMYGDLDGPHFNVAKVARGSDHLVWIIDEEDVGTTFHSPRRMPELARIFMREREAAKRRMKFNPARRAGNPADVKSEEKAIAEYYRLVHLPNDPHAMEVARDLVEAHGLSLRTLSENERTFDYDPSEREDHGKDFAGWFDIGNGEVVEWSVGKWSRTVPRRYGQARRDGRSPRYDKRAPLYECYYEIWNSKAIACDVCGGIQQGHTCCPPDAGPERGAFTKTFDLDAISNEESRSANYRADRVSLIAQVYGEKFAIDFAVETAWQIALLIKTLQAMSRADLSEASMGLYRTMAIVDLVRMRNRTIPKGHLRKEQR